MPDRVSVIIAVWNGETYLRDSIDSVLAQTVPATEVIVVDDGSTDGSAALARAFGGIVRVVSQPNSGQAAATAHGVSLASGDFIAINDADDVWTPNKLELQLGVLAADPTVEMVYGLCEQFVSPELDEEFKRRYAPPNAILPGALLQAGLVRRSAFDRVGNFNPALRGAGGADWMGRADEAGVKRVMLDQVTLLRRLHPNNYGRTNVAERDQNLLAVLRDKIRRRAAQQQQ